MILTSGWSCLKFVFGQFFRRMIVMNEESFESKIHAQMVVSLSHGWKCIFRKRVVRDVMFLWNKFKNKSIEYGLDSRLNLKSCY